MLCFVVRNTLKMTLQERLLTSIKNKILEDIFGNEVKKEKGVIDSESTDEFMAKVEGVSSKWEELEEHLGKEIKFWN